MKNWESDFAQMSQRASQHIVKNDTLTTVNNITFAMVVTGNSFVSQLKKRLSNKPE